MNPNVEQLRKLGYKIKIGHLRQITGKKIYATTMSRKEFEERCKDCGPWSENVNPQGGRTLVTVTDPQGKTAEGYAKCHAPDNYNRRIGIAIALGRAMKKLRLKEGEN